MQMAWGYAPPLLLETAVKHRVFDLLDQQPHTAAQVAQAVGGAERGWRMVLDALTGLQFLHKEQGLYRTTPESSNFLVTTKPTFAGGILKHMSTQLMPKWMRLDEIVQTGKPTAAVNQEGQGSEFFVQFVEDIFPMSYPATQVLAADLGLQHLQTPYRVLDVAAGSGVWGIGLAQASSEVKVVALDWPDVLEVTRRSVARFGLSNQFEFVQGDLSSTEFPKDLDLITLGHILHSEGEERSRHLLKKTADALKPGGRIAIAEWLPNTERTGPVNALIFAVNMLVNTEKGDAYTFEEIGGWLQEAGFTNARLLEAPGPSPLIIAEKPA